jgi:hypothetical protein
MGEKVMNSAKTSADTFKHQRARKNVIYGGLAIIIAITVLSAVSSFVIYRGGFTDLPSPFDKVLAMFAVIVVEGAFVWLLYGFTRAFASVAERMLSVIGLLFLMAVMLTNLVTHFMMVKNIPLADFQHGWIQWGAVTVFIGVLILTVLITLADPIIRLMRLELRYVGKEQEVIIQAKTGALDDDVIYQAMQARAQGEAQRLVRKIQGAPDPASARSVGFDVRVESGKF